MISVREAAPDDVPRIREVTSIAFEASPFGHNGESELIDQIRERCEDIVSLVACVDGLIVGHLLLSPVTLLNRPEFKGMGIGPMAVLPEAQRGGIGSTLIEAGLERARTNGSTFVVVLGHPDYYPRFGFERALDHDIRHGFTGIPQDVFFVQWLRTDERKDRSEPDLACYVSEFGPQG